jgi:hypothetical protein
LAIAESGRVWVGVRSWPAGVQDGALLEALAQSDAPDAALPGL